MEKITSEQLQDIPFTGLRKLAKRYGIKANMKRDSIVAALLCKYDDEENFKNLDQSIVNSSKKNKEKKFEADKTDVSETPRRETYSVETPINTTLPESTDIMSSPVLNVEVTDSSFSYLRVSRGSKRKSKKSKVSFITPAKSPRILRNSTPYVSLRDRPKTPVASKVSISKRISFVTPIKSLSSQPRKSRPSTPYPLKLSKKALVSQEMKVTRSSTPRSAIQKKNSLETGKSSSVVKVGQPVHTDKSLSGKKSVVTSSADEKSVKLKRIATPNFKKIHQKAFDKMESIDDYQKRKALNSAKKIKNQSVQKKIPVAKKNKPIATFSGIPFVPSVTNIKGIKFNFTAQPKRTVDASVPKSSNTSLNKNKDSGIKKKNQKEIMSGSKNKSASQENKRTKRNLKFDLKASLSKKLPYKPHVGPLKPLIEPNLNNSVLSTSCYHQKIEVQNQVSKIRNQSREVLHGVRTNRRFELQMQNRKI